MRHKPTFVPALSGLLALAVAAIACNLGASPATPTPNRPSPTPFVFVTATPQPTWTPFPTFPPVTAAPICTPNTTWPVYVVQAGDTLGSIASRSGTTADVLVAANCLSNPNVIVVGQRLRVPRSPVTPTPPRTPTIAGVPTITGVIIQPAVLRAPGLYAVSLGNVNVIAQGVGNAVRVTFYIALSGQPPTILGEDTNALDGWSVPWTILSTSLQAQVWAVAWSSTNQTAQSSPVSVVYDASTVPTIGSLAITPTVDSGEAGVLGVRPGPVLVSVTSVQNAAKVVFYFVSSVTGSVPQVIAEDANLADGAAVVWNVAGGSTGSGLVFAVAYSAAGQSATTASTPIKFMP